MPAITILNLFLLILIMISIIIIYFIGSILTYHKKYIQMQEEKLLNEITTLENERKRMANEIHDKLGPLWSSIKLYLNQLQNVSQDDKEVIVLLNQHINQAMRDIRAFSHHLLPIALEQGRFIDALNDYAVKINEIQHNFLHINIIECNELSKELEIHLFRIIQEITLNSKNSMHSTSLNIDLSIGLKNITIDAVAFIDPKEGQEPIVINKINIRGIISRVELLRGELELNYEPVQGLIYKIFIPHKK